MVVSGNDLVVDVRGPSIDDAAAPRRLVERAVRPAGSRWRRGGRPRSHGEEDGMRPAEVLERLGVRPAEADLTVVQFSTAFCGSCRATRARLQQLQATHPGLAHVQVDAESHLDAVRELGVRRTPTLFFLGRDGALLGRTDGPPRPADLAAKVAAMVAAAVAGSRG